MNARDLKFFIFLLAHPNHFYVYLVDSCFQETFYTQTV